MGFNPDANRSALLKIALAMEGHGSAAVLADRVGVSTANLHHLASGRKKSIRRIVVIDGYIKDQFSKNQALLKYALNLCDMDVTGIKQEGNA